jgi:hypothetical protein
MSPIERRLRETAIECLMLVGEHGGDPMVPRIAMIKSGLLHEPKHRHRAGNAPKPTRPEEQITLMVLDLCSAAFVGVE